MLYFRIGAALLAGLFFLFRICTGHSIRPRSLTNEAGESASLSNIHIHTAYQRITAFSEFNISATLQTQYQSQGHYHSKDENYGTPISLQLEPNYDILAHAPSAQRIDGNGNLRMIEGIERGGDRVFKGSVWIGTHDGQQEKAGWARIYIVRDGHDPLFHGAFTISGLFFDIKVLSENTEFHKEQVSRIAIYPSSTHPIRNKPNDHTDQTGTCTAKPLPSSPLTQQFLSKRQNADSSALTASNGDNSGCPSTRQIALVGIATDCTYTAAYDSMDNLRQDIVAIVNTASEVFENTFNIALSLHNLTISQETCWDDSNNGTNTNTSQGSGGSDVVPWNVGCQGRDLDWRLRQFADWRGMLSDTTNAYWTLLTGCPNDGQVGVSYVGEVCDRSQNVNVVAQSASQWQIFAHESAHTFGAVHDCTTETCSSSTETCCPLSSDTCSADAQYIMNPVSMSSQSEFSPCTVGVVCSALSSSPARRTCLLNGDTDEIPQLTVGQCGNGILEVGEECDCGDECDGNECCDGSTCRFTNGAVCDDATGSCCTNCQFLSSETVCRESTGECDVAETCTGTSSACPSDQYQPDGQSCGNTTALFCASGQCTSRDIQCQDALDMTGSGVSSCNNDTCTLSCSNNWESPGSCMAVDQQIIDGTPCSGGLCRGGQCQVESDGSWVERHKGVVIGICAGVGGALVLAVLGVIACFWRKRRMKANTVATKPMTEQLIYK